MEQVVKGKDFDWYEEDHKALRGKVNKAYIRYVKKNCQEAVAQCAKACASEQRVPGSNPATAW